AALDTRHREGGGRRPGFGVHGPLEMHQRAQWKSGGAEASMRLGGIRYRERCEMHAAIARHGDVELGREWRRGGLEPHLDVAAREHGAAIAGASRRAVRIGLHRTRRRCKAAARERAARRIAVRDEVADVIEENLLALRQLAIDFGVLGAHSLFATRYSLFGIL